MGIQIHHPPCTPESGCSPYRCHPALPPCLYPEKCLKNSKKKGTSPCLSAVAILAEKATFTKKRDEKKSMQAVNKWIKKKAKEKKKEEKAAEKAEKDKKRKKPAAASARCCKPGAKKVKVIAGKEHKPGPGCSIL